MGSVFGRRRRGQSPLNLRLVQRWMGEAYKLHWRWPFLSRFKVSLERGSFCSQVATVLSSVEPSN